MSQIFRILAVSDEMKEEGKQRPLMNLAEFRARVGVPGARSLDQLSF